jgi:hypothetical protein
MERFRTCDECSRHVRAAEPKCPFCGQELAAASLMSIPRAPAQLSRAQRIALVAAVAGGLAACGDDTVGQPGPKAGTGVAGASAGTGAAGASGAAAGSGAGAGAAGKGAAGSPPVAVPVYGAPFPVPAGSGGSSGGAGKAGSGGAAGAAGSAGSAGTAGSSAGSGGAAGAAGHPMVQPLYGASPAYGVPPTPQKK